MGNISAPAEREVIIFTSNITSIGGGGGLTVSVCLEKRRKINHGVPHEVASSSFYGLNIVFECNSPFYKAAAP